MARGRNGKGRNGNVPSEEDSQFGAERSIVGAERSIEPTSSHNNIGRNIRLSLSPGAKALNEDKIVLVELCKTGNHFLHDLYI